MRRFHDTGRRYRCTWLAAVLALLCTAPAVAADEAPGAWLIFTATDRLGTDDPGSRWRYWFDGQYRFFDRAGGIHQAVIRPAIGRDVGGGASAWLGYAWLGTERERASSLTEQRLWQQLSLPGPSWGTNRLGFRARLLERWRNDSDDLAVTLRLQARFERRLAGDHAIVVTAEPWFDFRDTDWAGEQGLTQTRVTAGVALPPARFGRFEIGYLNQRLLFETRRDQSNHLLYVSFRPSR